MFNNTLAELEGLLSPRDAERVIDNKPEDYHRDGGRAAEAAAGAEYTQSRVDSLLWAFRDVGYLYADLNPLGESYSERFTRLVEARESSYHRLTLEEFGLDEADLDSDFFAGGGMKRTMSLRDVLAAFRRILADPRVAGRFVFVLIHYAPRRADGSPDQRLHGLENADDFLAASQAIAIQPNTRP